MIKPTGNYTITWYKDARTPTPLGKKIYPNYQEAKKLNDGFINGVQDVLRLL